MFQHTLANEIKLIIKRHITQFNVLYRLTYCMQCSYAQKSQVNDWMLMMKKMVCVKTKLD